MSSCCKLSQTQEKRLLAELKKEQGDPGMVALRQTYWKALKRRAKLDADPDPAKQSQPVVMPMKGAGGAQKPVGQIIKGFEKTITGMVAQVAKTGLRNLYVPACIRRH